MKFLAIDQHIAVSADLRCIFNDLGHTVNELSLSGHARVIGKASANIPMLQGESWCGLLLNDKWDDFYTVYKDELDKYDGFICCYPPIFSMLYKNTGKPIIVDIPIRYDYGVFNHPEKLKAFDEYLRAGVDRGQIYLVANSLYDQRYAEGFVGREVEYIPSFCQGYTGMSYNPVRDKFLCYAGFNIEDASHKLIKKHEVLPTGHAWQEVANFRGCVHFPYQISTMSIFEQYAANIPLFFPSKRFLIEMYEKGTTVLNHLSWDQLTGKYGTRQCGEAHEFDPNDYKDISCVNHWIQFADYYGELSCMTYFDNLAELNEYLHMPDDQLMRISNAMRHHNTLRKMSIYSKWSNMLDKVQGL